MLPPPELARRIRILSVKMTSQARSSHLGSCFSMAEILAVLYARILRVKPHDPSWPERDRFILSKGHAAAAYYAVLSEMGFLQPDRLREFYHNGSYLLGHVTHKGIPGVEVSTGSLGHGLPIGTGMALAAKRDGKRWRAFVLLSDGECDEGSVWEAALLAAQHKLDNLMAIIDYNKIQSLGRTEEVISLEPLGEKWRAFGWATREVNGHDVCELESALTVAPFTTGRPSCLIAHTVKGKGVSFMENSVLWHYRSPQGDELHAALAELGEKA